MEGDEGESIPRSFPLRKTCEFVLDAAKEVGGVWGDGNDEVAAP